MFQTLYKAKDDKFLQWSIEVEGDKYRVHSGQEGGKIVTSTWKYATPKNIGKANETTPEEQAQAEADAIYKQKIEKGYQLTKTVVPNISKIDPMLAKKFDDYESKISYPFFTQPKLDGIRCVITRKGMFTRNNKLITSCPHIFDEALKFLNKYPDIEALDGELYSHELFDNFNKIVSLVKRVKCEPLDYIESEKYIKYHCYDIVSELQFSKRNFRIYTELSTNEYYKYIVYVETSSIHNKSMLDEQHEKYLADGYEGTIVRLDAPYEKKRSKNLLKKKDFMDAEFKILDIIEGEGNRYGTAGYIETITNDGKPFKSSIKGTFEYLTELLVNKQQYIGKQATIKYFQLTPDGIPRFPYVIDIDRHE